MLATASSLILDLIVAALLAVTIAYCWALNRRIKVLQDSKSELAQLLKYFDESTEKASESIIALQTASKKIGENIQHRVDKANYLLEDLSFMIEKGNKLADQMEAGFAVSRARAKVLSEREIEPAEPPRPTHEKPAAPRQPSTSAREKTSASLEAALERIVGRARAANANDDVEPDEEEPAVGRGNKQRPRSKTEQELLNLLKAGLKG